MKKDILTIISILVVILALGAYFVFAPKAPELDYRPVDVGGGSITVEDQYDMDRVVLDATLAAPGFITIHESMSGAPATIIGTSQYLDIGTYDDLTIMLVDEMLPGYSYITLLHADDGDGIFVIDDDLPVEVDGEVVRPDFVADPSSVR
ncbi:MAG: hypothetical protein ABIA47_03925 [bacterium]